MSVAGRAEHDELRRVVRDFLGEKSPGSAVRRLMEAGNHRDDEVWALLAGQLGLTGIAVPERYGGAGYGPAELGIVLEEMGGALLVAPYFATVALAGQVLAASGDEDAMARWLPGIADGSLTATLAVAEESGSWELAEVAATAQPTAGAAGGGWTVSGDKLFVIDGDTADLLLVTAHAPDGPGVFAIERSAGGNGAAGLESARLDTLDLTRALASVTLRETPAVRGDGRRRTPAAARGRRRPARPRLRPRFLPTRAPVSSVSFWKEPAFVLYHLLAHAHVRSPPARLAAPAAGRAGRTGAPTTSPAAGTGARRAPTYSRCRRGSGCTPWRRG